MLTILQNSNLRKDSCGNLKCHMAESVSYSDYFGLQISKNVYDSFKKNQATVDYTDVELWLQGFLPFELDGEES
jgi:hypothetical protein